MPIADTESVKKTLDCILCFVHSLLTFSFSHESLNCGFAPTVCKNFAYTYSRTSTLKCSVINFNYYDGTLSTFGACLSKRAICRHLPELCRPAGEQAVAQGVRSQRERSFQVNTQNFSFFFQWIMEVNDLQKVSGSEDGEGEKGSPGDEHQVPRGSSPFRQARLILPRQGSSFEC
jgi:hypothetical protein